MKIDEKIRAMRKARNWSQEEMAEKINMSVGGYAKIERGETIPHIPKLRKIADIFDVNLLELLTNEKSVYLIAGDNNSNNLNSNNSAGGYNIISTPSDIAFEIQRLKAEISHQDEIVSIQKREIARLEEMLSLMKFVCQCNAFK